MSSQKVIKNSVVIAAMSAFTAVFLWFYGFFVQWHTMSIADNVQVRMNTTQIYELRKLPVAVGKLKTGQENIVKALDKIEAKL